MCICWWVSIEHRICARIVENQSDLGPNQEERVKKQHIKDLDFTICENGHKSSAALE